MAGLAFPSWAYNSLGQAPQIVASQAAFNALTAPGTWSLTPFPPVPPSGVPFDPTPSYPVTDTRLQQILLEQRVTNLLLKEGMQIFNEVDLTGLRTDMLNQDSGLGT